MEDLEIVELLPEGPEREPQGIMLLGGRQVGVYRCSLERQALLAELEEQQSHAE